MESRRARRSRRARPARRRPYLPLALAAVAVLGATAGGAVYVKARAHSGARPVSSSSATPPASASRDEGVTVGTEETAGQDRDASLASAMGAVTVPGGAAVSVAVLDLASGERAAYGGGAFDTASVVKADILAALLLRAQDEGRRLTTAEKAYATAMIETSDNDAASALWRAIGEAEGLDAANARLGLTATEGGEGMLWGLTRTTAADQLALLRQVFGDDSELSEASRTYVRALMGRIAAGQDWGVSAAADGSAWALKNGWLPRSTTGLWVVNSIGRVSAGGGDYAVAVLSNGNATQQAGIALVEAAARAAVSVFADGRATASPSAAGAG
ncbi:class A beta-lactamase-related serine hydrolase [Streptomyces hilarionis]|uniref:class A beta-lactamase-related serine hydrolase n=1 Tax=Streptomyces hilarionis TaxID=2839954 RepID=UPI00211A9BA1|nr:class A beta-lactamase-related serine hydrolase [Streptomyces hilarionis]MCQ9133046.1 class A beta-lactamase-related serine hydrolase [Streptomyces hilarionis]